jgi:hypothetical protein
MFVAEKAAETERWKPDKVFPHYSKVDTAPREQRDYTFIFPRSIEG